jgi:hypothetical protein
MRVLPLDERRVGLPRQERAAPRRDRLPRGDVDNAADAGRRHGGERRGCCSTASARSPLDDLGLVDSAFADLLPNGSLEADPDHDSLSDRTQRTVLGTSIGAFARSAVTPHAGAFAETLSLTSLTSGDRKVLTSFDAACAPPATPGLGYLAGAWYRY